MQDKHNTFAFHVRAFGACGDGTTSDTRAIQATIDRCASAGGGTVVVSAGAYVTGAIELRSHVTLLLEAGAVLLGSQDMAEYPLISARWEGVERTTHAPLIGGRGLENVAISGRGTIDGRGQPWWDAYHTKTLAAPRPRLVSFTECSNVLIEGITAINSPSWTINPVRCHNVRIQGITIRNPADSPNTDGINPDSCRNVRIADCYISVGDDCVTIKSGTEDERPDMQAPCENIAITNCTMADGHGGVVIGSEMSGDVRNVVISNCVFVGTDRGIRLKSRRGRGGLVEDIRVSNIVMTDVLCPLTMNLYYACGMWGDATVSDKQAHPVTDATPRFRHIHLSHITARNAKVAAAFLFGLAEMPVEDISLSDVTIGMAESAEAGYADMADGLELMERAGLYIRNARRIRLHQVEVRGHVGPAIRIADAQQVEISASTTPTPAPGAPVIALQNVQGAFIHGCHAYPGTEVFVQLDDGRSSDVALVGNHLGHAAQPLREYVAAEPERSQISEVIER